MPSTITQIWNGVIRLWNDAEAAINKDVAVIQSVLPASAQPAFTATISALKQDASDAISGAQSALNAVLPGLVTDAEKLLDNALVTYTNGLALPLVPATNQAVEDIVSAGKAALDSWALSAKAALAANNKPA